MEVIRQVLGISGVLLLLSGSLWWLRRKGFVRQRARGGGPRTLETVERVMLSPQHSLHLVRLAERGLLVGISPAGCTVLESFDWHGRLPGEAPQ